MLHVNKYVETFSLQTGMIVNVNVKRQKYTDFFPIPELYNAAKPSFCISSLIIIKYITGLLPMCPFFTSPAITLVFPI